MLLMTGHQSSPYMVDQNKFFLRIQHIHSLCIQILMSWKILFVNENSKILSLRSTIQNFMNSLQNFPQEAPIRMRCFVQHVPTETSHGILKGIQKVDHFVSGKMSLTVKIMRNFPSECPDFVSTERKW